MTDEVAVGAVTETAAEAMVVIQIVKGLVRSVLGHHMRHRLATLVSPMITTMTKKATTSTSMTRE